MYTIQYILKSTLYLGAPMKVNLNRASQLSALNGKLVTQCGTMSMSVRYGNGNHLDVMCRV